MIVWFISFPPIITKTSIFMQSHRFFSMCARSRLKCFLINLIFSATFFPSLTSYLISFLILVRSQPQLLIKHILIRKKECNMVTAFINHNFDIFAYKLLYINCLLISSPPYGMCINLIYREGSFFCPKCWLRYGLRALLHAKPTQVNIWQATKCSD